MAKASVQWQEAAYKFTCGDCDLEEFDDVNAIDPDDGGGDYKGYDSKEKCVAAWQEWFLESLKGLINDGKLLKWLKDI